MLFSSLSLMTGIKESHKCKDWLTIIQCKNFQWCPIHSMETAVLVLWVPLNDICIIQFVTETSEVFHHDFHLKRQSQACSGWTYRKCRSDEVCCKVNIVSIIALLMQWCGSEVHSTSFSQSAVRDNVRLMLVQHGYVLNRSIIWHKILI